MSSDRGCRRVVRGVVHSDKMQKTIAVRVEDLAPHREFGKFVRRRTVCKAHDEKGEAKAGDLVELVETRPLSATKRWRLLRVLRRAGGTEAVSTS